MRQWAYLHGALFEQSLHTQAHICLMVGRLGARCQADRLLHCQFDPLTTSVVLLCLYRADVAICYRHGRAMLSSPLLSTLGLVSLATARLLDLNATARATASEGLAHTSVLFSFRHQCLCVCAAARRTGMRIFKTRLNASLLRSRVYCPGTFFALRWVWC